MLRHCFGSQLAEAGVDSFTIMELMGHSDLRMTERYVYATDPHKREAVAKLENLGAAKANSHKRKNAEDRVTFRIAVAIEMIDSF